MTIAEYAIARRVHQLEEAAKTRPLTRKEQAFLVSVRGLMERLAKEETK